MLGERDALNVLSLWKSLLEASALSSAAVSPEPVVLPSFTACVTVLRACLARKDGNASLAVINDLHQRWEAFDKQSKSRTRTLTGGAAIAAADTIYTSGSQKLHFFLKPDLFMYLIVLKTLRSVGGNTYLSHSVSLPLSHSYCYPALYLSTYL